MERAMSSRLAGGHIFCTSYLTGSGAPTPLSCSFSYKAGASGNESHERDSLYSASLRQCVIRHEWLKSSLLRLPEVDVGRYHVRLAAGLAGFEPATHGPRNRWRSPPARNDADP